MSQSPRSFENRWLVTATLTTTSPLIVHTGEQKKRERCGDDDDAGSVNLIERDVNGLPYIPGTSLKGGLRAWLVERAGNSKGAVIEKLFGREPRPEQLDDREVDRSRGGRLEFQDARSEGEGMTLGEKQERWIEETGSTAIDPATGAAKRRMLRHTELVPAGTAFSIEIAGDGIEQHEMALLRAALDALGDGAIPLGADGSSGKGLCHVDEPRFRMIDANGLREWLDTRPTRPWIDDARDHAALDRTVEAEASLDPALPTIELDLFLRFDGPFLVSKAAAKEEGGQDGEPDREPVREGYDGYYLPGESLRGALRAQARRIVNTLDPGKRGDEHPSLCRLFGPGGQSAMHFRGAIDVGDFKVVEPPSEPLPVQEFVAIDRFTGGAADGKKFAARHLDRPIVRGCIKLSVTPRRHRLASGKRDSRFNAIRHRAVRREDIGLLALVLRDLAEGDIPLGYGKTKGYGACRIESATLSLRGDEALWETLERDDEAPGSAFATIFHPWRGEVRKCVEQFRKASRPAT